LKTCKRCLKDFPDDYSIDNPAVDLDEIYVDAIGTINANDLCPECREDLGIMNILGFGL
jgi:hypothetical protein